MSTRKINLMYRYRTRKGEAGFSLIELMVAMTIGLILLASVSTIFVTSRSVYTMEEGMGRVQEAGRFAMEFLAQDIRMAGYAGCTNNVKNIAKPATDAYQILAGGVRGYTYSGTPPANTLADWSPALPAEFFSDGDVLPETDVILVTRAMDLETNLTGNMDSDNGNVKVAESWAIAQQVSANDTLIISDCSNADVFRATAVSNGEDPINITHASNVNTDNKLSKAYQTNAQLSKLISRVYYIRPGASATDEPSLMREDLGESAQELVQGIEQLRMVFGEDTDADGISNIYRVASDVTNWSNIKSVRIGMLVRTPANVAADTDTTRFAGSGIELVDGVSIDAAGDNRRRQVYKSTILVRR